MLFVQDTTELDFTHMRAAEGYGPIGNHAGCGLMVHSLMALGTSGEVFGLAAQRCWARSSGPTRKGTENSGQAARTLNLSLAWSAVQVCPPVNDPKYKGCEPLDASVLRVWDAQHAVEWILLFTGTLNSFDEAAQCVGWYEQRWSIEEFHKCLKSGCRIEHSQLKQARAVQALLGFSSIVAVRLLALARLARARPDEPAAQHIEASYLRVLCAMRKLLAELTVRAYWREVAKMGGFLGRTHDRDPGWQTLWKGLEKLEAWVVTWLDGFEEGRTCG
jgi:hypothetical protein